MSCATPVDHADGAVRTGATTSTSRRRFLAGSAALAGGAALGGGTVGLSEIAAGNQVTETAIIPGPEPWADDNLAGFMIHVGGSQSPVETRVAADCDYRDWPPDTITAYEATIINRKVSGTPQQEINLHISDAVTVSRGALYLINQFERCENGYVGVQLEQIGLRDVSLTNESDAPVVDVEDDERPNTGTGGQSVVGPGFGALATVGGLLGAGLLARLREKRL